MNAHVWAEAFAYMTAPTAEDRSHDRRVAVADRRDAEFKQTSQGYVVGVRQGETCLVCGQPGSHEQHETCKAIYKEATK